MNKMQERLTHLRQRGFNPKCILDIGAYKGEWTRMAANIFPQAKFHLFEANPENEPLLKIKGFDYSIALLGDSDDKFVSFMTTKSTQWQTGNSIFRENTRHYTDENINKSLIKMSRLDTLLKEKDVGEVDFIKLDVQGAELLVLNGAVETLKTVEAILLEVSILEWNAGAPLLQEVCSYMSEIDFITYDIVDLHYIPSKNLLNQIDMIFLKKGSSLFPKGLLC